MATSDEFDKIVRGDGKPATTEGLYNPRHAARMPREFTRGAIYILRAFKAWWRKRRG